MLKIENFQLRNPNVHFPNFELERGDILRLGGKSGGGKTSFFLALLGLREKTFDKFLWKEESVDKLNPESGEVCFVSQFHFNAQKTAHEFIEEVFGYKANKEKSYKPELLKLCRKEFLLSQKLESFSGGEKQLLLMDIVKSLDPDILLLDEADSSMDQEMEERLWRYLKEWLKNRATIFTTHRQTSLCEFQTKSASV